MLGGLLIEVLLVLLVLLLDMESFFSFALVSRSRRSVDFEVTTVPVEETRDSGLVIVVVDAVDGEWTTLRIFFGDSALARFEGVDGLTDKAFFSIYWSLPITLLWVTAWRLGCHILPAFHLLWRMSTIRWRRLRRTPLPQRRRLFPSMRSRTWWHLAMGERLGRVTFPLISGRAFLHCFLIIFRIRWRHLQSEPGHNIYDNSMNIRGCAEESRRFVRAGLLWWSFVKMKRYNWNH